MSIAGDFVVNCGDCIFVDGRKFFLAKWHFKILLVALFIAIASLFVNIGMTLEVKFKQIIKGEFGQTFQNGNLSG